MKFIDEAKSLDDAVADLRGNDRIHVDTEFESNRSGTTLCLIQLCADEGEVYVIDALALDDLRPLRKVLGRKRVEWVMHAGKQDVDLLMEALGLRYKPKVFDTQVAWSLCSPEYQVSLAYLEATLLGVVPEKGLQTDDWTKRPLPDEYRAYAAADVEHLPALYKAIVERMGDEARVALVEAVSAEVLDPPAEPTPPLSLGSYRNLWQLGARQRAALAWMIDWYNALDDEARDRAPHRKVLFSVASRLPETKTALRGIKGVPRRFADKEGGDFVTAMNEAIADVEDAPAAAAPTPYASFDALHRDALLQCARADVCAAMRIAPELAFPGWLTRQLREAIDHGGDFTRAAGAFTGWRTILRAPWNAFCRSVGLA